MKRAVDNPHELPILEQTDIKSVGLTAEQTQLLSARKDIILDIANLLGIPPHKLGLAISTSYGSLEEENDAFRDDALDPWLVQFEMEYRKLLTEDEQALETHCIVATRHDVARMKASDRAEYLSTLTGAAPVMTVNEARAIQGLGPVPGGDVLRTPMNMSPADAKNPAAAAAERLEPEDEETDDTEESAMRSHQLQALEDVFSRMAKRLATAIQQGQASRPAGGIPQRAREAHAGDQIRICPDYRALRRQKRWRNRGNAGQRIPQPTGCARGKRHATGPPSRNLAKRSWRNHPSSPKTHSTHFTNKQRKGLTMDIAHLVGLVVYRRRRIVGSCGRDVENVQRRTEGLQRRSVQSCLRRLTNSTAK